MKPAITEALQKRPNRALLEKEDLNLACPFHKYKPWKYNHGILRFRTCSTTPFDAIFRLKEHLRRVHTPPIHCTRCWLSFASQDSLVTHGQANIPCQRRQPIHVEGWTADMDRRVTKRKDETEQGRWERIYRELFGTTLANLPSPYFVPYDLAAANDANLETLLHQEVPRIDMDSLSEQVNNMDIPDAARALFDPSAPYFQFENLIGNAIREVFTTYRSAIATTNSPEAPLSPQPSSENRSIVGDSSASQSTNWERTPRFHHQVDDFEPSPTGAPPMSLDIPQQWNGTRRQLEDEALTYLGFTREQVPPPATEFAPQTSETASSLFPSNPSSQLPSAGEFMQQDGHHDVTSAYNASMDEYMFVNFDLDGGFDDEAFLNVSSGSDGAPACS